MVADGQQQSSIELMFYQLKFTREGKEIKLIRFACTYMVISCEEFLLIKYD
jgi:hypothetical protein